MRINDVRDMIQNYQLNNKQKPFEKKNVTKL